MDLGLTGLFECVPFNADEFIALGLIVSGNRNLSDAMVLAAYRECDRMPTSSWAGVTWCA
jgi:hypothetical protein